MRRSRLLAIPTVTAAIVLSLPTAVSAAPGSCSVTGAAFLDANRNGVQDAGETARSGDVLYLFDSTGAYVSNVATDAQGGYSIAGIACGSYSLQYAANTWWGIRDTLVPTTTGSPLPNQTFTVTGSSRVDFGWRTITRSTTAGAPLDSYTGPQGLRVESYDNVISARTLYDAVMRATVGPEASHVTVRFDLTPSSMTNSAIGATNGSYTSFSATSNVDYVSWLDNGDTVLVHEYGHAWTLYRAYLLQQDPAMSGYLHARGIYGDARIGSSYAWATNELIAEDYRQLLGSPTAAVARQTNSDLPPAASVPGLKDYLLGAFSTAVTPSPSPSPTASPTPTASPSASPSPSPSASPSPSTSPSASPTPKPTTAPCKGKGCRATH